ncbi:RHS repeat-associated core domain-containing protein [Sorangium sp. So ce131]|uniref:RHS repeat-associated core domain-containing protein n=1 Tax=Sorangium sp. So ce131 TaxID=3133282 RepID=UPI003F629829
MPIPLPSFGPVALAGCASVLINGIPAARAGDMGISLLCGTFAPPFEVFTGSSKVFFGGARAARMLDITMHCMPGAGAAKAMSTLMKVVSVGAGVVGVGAEVLDAATKAERAKRLRAKKVAPKAIDPGEAAKMTPEELAAAKEAAAAEAAAEQQDNLEEAAAEEASAKITGIQAGLDAAALALGLLMGMDPGTPPCIGAVLTGHPNVLIGGFPMPPWSAVARGLGKLGKKPKKRGPRILPKLKCMFTGHPIDPVTGANVDTFVDYETDEPAPFRWVRSYTSLAAGREGPMGRGFRHSYQRELVVDLDQAVYTDGEGRVVTFPLPVPDAGPTFREGYALAVREERAEIVYSIDYAGEPTMEFARQRGADAQPRLARLISTKRRVEVVYDGGGRMVSMLETSEGAAIETRLDLDEHGRILAVRRGPRGARQLPLIAAYGYDSAGSLLTFQDALGARAHYAYDAPGRIVRMTDRNGYSFHYTYDAEGRCVEEHGDDGLHRVSLRYEPEHRRTVVTKADGGVWTYEYDEHGTLTCLEDPYGGRRRWLLDEEGRITEEVGPDGRTTLTFLYDAAGRHSGVADVYGYVHPPLDEGESPTDPLEHKVPATPLEQQWGSLFTELTVQGSPAAWLPPGEPFAASSELSPSRPPERSRDAAGRIVAERDREGCRTEWTHDPAGNVVRHRDRDGREHRTAIASWNLVGAEIDPLGNQTHFVYSPDAEVTRIIDPGGSHSGYSYDLKGRLVGVQRHGLTREEYVYDRCDRLVEKRDGEGNALLRWENGDDGLSAELQLASGEFYRYAYDGRGRETRVSQRGVEIERAYDERGRRVLDERGGIGVRHGFHTEGRSEPIYVGSLALVYRRAHEFLSETSYLGRFKVTYRRDEDGTLLVEPPVGGVQRFQRGESLSILATLGNGTRSLTAHDHEGRCLGRTVWRARGNRTARWSVDYSYTAEGELRRVRDDARGSTEYTYDAAGRLTGETRPDGVKTSISLDAAGNILEKPGLSRVELSEGNRLARAAGERFRYDKRNHLAEIVNDDGEVTRYGYDGLDMLVKVSWSGREEQWTAGYDGLGRRLYKSYGGQRTDFYWDGDRLAAEVSPSGAVRIYVYPGAEALVPFMFIDYASMDADPASGRPFYVFVNQIGVPLHIEDQAGHVVWKAEHVDPYGLVTVAPGASVSYSLRFPGHFYDEETGLFYNRYRYYSPRLGRYLQSDPVGQSGGINLYSYPSNPLVHVDLLGLTDCTGGAKGKGRVDPRRATTEEAADRVKEKNRAEAEARRKEARARQLAERRGLGSLVEIHHLDVGQGDATLLVFKNKDAKEKPIHVLIDGGKKTAGGKKIIEYAKKENIKQIDVIICTHYDADHMEGLTYIMDSKEGRGSGLVGPHTKIYDRGDTGGPKDDKVIYYENAIKNSGAERVDASSDAKRQELLGKDILEGKGHSETRMNLVAIDGWQKTSDGRFVRILEGSGALDENSRSLGFLVKAGDFTYFTAGDLQHGGEWEVASSLGEGGHWCAIKVGHHGAETSTSSDLVEKTNPSAAFISAGAQSYEHPAQSVVNTLEGAGSVKHFYLTGCDKLTIHIPEYGQPQEGKARVGGDDEHDGTIVLRVPMGRDGAPAHAFDVEYYDQLNGLVTLDHECHP